ncbi:hypothetical protein ACIREE_11535 [Streptomyces sp. NPDC102467]|uniref:hypothetical protein n=1 Tax=Streptomyces sp. NPDC102467 TaxID=3366179 RepID=UPI003805328B
MTLNSNETRQVLTARSRESNAVVADASMPHGSDKRQAKGPHKVGTPETDETAALRDHWAAAKKHWLRGDHPEYASPDWRDLDPEDPRKLAGALQFAEMWRKYGDEIAGDLNQALRAPQDLWRYPSLADLDQAHEDMLARARRSTGKEAA